jgi:hypothetical protein
MTKMSATVSYSVLGTVCDNVRDATDAAEQIARAREAKRDTVSSSTKVHDTVRVLRSDGTVAATVRP